MLLPRVLTAIVGIPLMLFLIHWGGLSFALFTTAIAALALYEYGVLLLLGGKPAQRLTAALCGSSLALCQALQGPLGLILAGSAAVIVLREMAARDSSLERAALTLFGAVFIGWMPAHLALIRDIRPFGERLTFMVFVSIWVCDTSAYFVGRAMGKHKLAPILSPKKTWEGFVAGFIGSTAVVFAFRAATPAMMTLPRAIATALAIGLLGQVSDIAESMVKRAVGAKDSGAILPGHGGVMDRFDSFILAAPAVYYCLTF
jgi:phosphatidate cytidylyltransferase